MFYTSLIFNETILHELVNFEKEFDQNILIFLQISMARNNTVLVALLYLHVLQKKTKTLLSNNQKGITYKNLRNKFSLLLKCWY